MKILGIDIGTHAIKAVEFDNTFGKVELVDFHIEPVKEAPLAGVDLKENSNVEESLIRKALSGGQIEALKRFANYWYRPNLEPSQQPLKSRQYDRLVVNLPRSWTSSRIFTFPTKDKKMIQSSLQFELDDDIPFSMQDIVFDFATLKTTASHSTVYTALALKQDIMNLVSGLQILGLDPDMITTDAWATGFVLQRSLSKDLEKHPVCVVNIGSQQTSIQIFLEFNPIVHHVIQFGGSDITRAIAQHYKISFDEAEKGKRDGAFVLTLSHYSLPNEKITDDQKIFSAVIENAIQPILREIKQCLISYKAQYRHSPQAVFLTGGSSLISNLPLYFEEHLELPVFPLTYMSNVVGQTLQLSEQSEAQIAVASGLALSMVKIDRNHVINFRKDDFIKSGGVGSFRVIQYQKPLQYIGAALAFIYLNLIIQSIILSSRSSSQQVQLEKTIRSVLGSVNDTVLNTYVRSPSILKTAVSKEIAKYKTATASPPKPQVSAMDLLHKVSNAFPKDMVLDINGFQIKDGQFRLVGLIDSTLNADRILKALEDTKIFMDLNKTKIQEDPKTRKLNFEIIAKLGPEASQRVKAQ